MYTIGLMNIRLPCKTCCLQDKLKPNHLTRQSPLGLSDVAEVVSVDLGLLCDLYLYSKVVDHA